MCSSARSTAGDGGISGHKEHSGCIVSIKGNILIVSVALKSFDLGSLCWLAFSKESTVGRKIQPSRSKPSKTQSLKEDMRKYSKAVSAAFK